MLIMLHYKGTAPVHAKRTYTFRGKRPLCLGFPSYIYTLISELGMFLQC